MCAHDYIMNGIYTFYPEEYGRYCKSLDKNLVKFLDKGQIRNKKIPKFNIPFFSSDDIFGKKGYFIISPASLHIREY